MTPCKLNQSWCNTALNAANTTHNFSRSLPDKLESCGSICKKRIPASRANHGAKPEISQAPISVGPKNSGGAKSEVRALPRTMPSAPHCEKSKMQMRRTPLGKKIKETWVDKTSAGNRAELRKYKPAYTKAVPITKSQALIKKTHT